MGRRRTSLPRPLAFKVDSASCAAGRWSAGSTLEHADVWTYAGSWE